MEFRKTVRSSILPGILLLISLSILSCDTSVSQDMNITGTVQHMDTEGGFYAIRADDNTVYDPVNLEPRYQVHDLRVHVTAIPRDDIANIHMVGQVIEIITISESP